MKLIFAAIFLITLLSFAAIVDAKLKCGANERIITCRRCLDSCNKVNLPKKKRCHWPCTKVKPQCVCVRNFFRNATGKCVPKDQC